MTSFHEIRFPVAVSVKSSSQVMRKTDIVTLASGAEQRNSRWAHSRRRYNAGFGVSSLSALQAVQSFFEERRGALYGFRFKDPLDFAAALQVIGTGDGATASFQLVKTYGSGGTAYTRKIVKPVAGSVKVFVNGVEKTITTHWTVDVTTGIVTFTGGNIPAAATVVTASFEFDVPVRFEKDVLEVNLSAVAQGDVPEISLVEIA